MKWVEWAEPVSSPSFLLHVVQAWVLCTRISTHIRARAYSMKWLHVVFFLSAPEIKWLRILFASFRGRIFIHTHTEFCGAHSTLHNIYIFAAERQIAARRWHSAMPSGFLSTRSGIDRGDHLRHTLDWNSNLKFALMAFNLRHVALCLVKAQKMLFVIVSKI